MIQDKIMGMFELSNDLLYQKIPQERRWYYIEESLQIGREAAQRLMKESDFEGIHDLYQTAQIEIEYLEESGKTYGVAFRAQSEFDREGNAKVLIYKGSIRELSEHSNCMPEELVPEVSGITMEKALEIHLAHEFFHYLEYHSSEIKDEKTMKYHSLGVVSEYLDSIESMRIFGWKRNSKILRCSEIAAHAFAKTMTGIEVLPNYYDYCYLTATGKIRAEDFQAMLETYKDLLCN